MNDMNEKKNNSAVEQEYLRMLNEETPDLWNRIEAGLDADYAPYDQGFCEPEEVIERKRPRYGLIIPGVAVAAVVLFLSIFALTGGFDRKKNADKSADLSSDSSMTANESKEDYQMENADSTKKNESVIPDIKDATIDINGGQQYSSNIRKPEEREAADIEEPEAVTEAASAAESAAESQDTGSDNDKIKGARSGDNNLITDISGVISKEALNRNRANADNGTGTIKELKKGDVAPDFTIDLYGGGTFHMSDYDDQIVVLNIWATWCSTCVAELPGLQKLENEGIEGVKVLCVESGDPEREVEWAVKDGGYTFSVGLDNKGKVTKYYPCVYIPYTVVIDHGVVAAVVEEYGPREIYTACKKVIEDCMR